MTNTSFSPQTDTVPAGTTVTWCNKDGFAHTVTADDRSFDSGNVPVNGTFERTFDQAGTVPYHCTIHGEPESGMFGTLVVE